MGGWGPFDWLAFVLIAIPAVQMALDKVLEGRKAVTAIRSSRLWNYAPITCICGAVFLIVLDHFGAFGYPRAHFPQVEIGPGAEIRGPITIYDETGRVFYSVPENGVTQVPAVPR